MGLEIFTQVSSQEKSHNIKLQKEQKCIHKTSMNLGYMLNILVGIKVGEPLNQEVHMLLPLMHNNVHRTLTLCLVATSISVLCQYQNH